MPERSQKTCFIRFEPSGLKVKVPQGTVLLEAARKVGVYLSSICGGDGYCGKCKVAVNEGQFRSNPTTLLTPEEMRRDVVLACQTKVLSDMIVTIPKSHALTTDQILISEDTSRFSVLAGDASEKGFDFKPLVQKTYLELSPPTIDDHTADHERLNVAIRNSIDIDVPVLQMGFRVLQELPHLLKKADYKVTATIGFRGGAMEAVQVEPGDRSGTNYAIAADIGTTTVVIQLMNLGNGTIVDTEAAYNSQINFGEDYIRRIMYAEQNNAFDQMQASIVNDVNGLIVTLAERNQVSLQDITAVICAGNTAMIHFLLNLDATRIRREPYVASANFIPPIRAAEAGIQINKRGLLYFLPSVAAYVGGDIVGGVLATGLNTRSDVALFVDIGTNGEVVLGNKDWMMCASSSAGPAFEGSGVKDGMRASSGAIEKLRISPNGSVSYKTIGDGHPAGICGSGLLDTISELFVNGIIDRTGRFAGKDDERLVEGEDGWQFTLVPADGDHKEIVITQADISNLIRSKAGVFAAIKVLMDTTQTRKEDLGAV
ncbi:MAG: ASKHA domain-containing protein, partial [Planctomycetota bacterium]